MFREKGPDLLNIIECKSTGPGSFSNVVCEIQLIINHNSKVSEIVMKRGVC